MRVAYLVTAYNNPELLNTVIGLLLDAGGAVFLHLDAKCPLGPADVARRDEVRFVEPAVKVYWGDNAFAESLVLLLELALESGEFDYFHAVSGSDLPIRPLSEFHQHLADLHPRDLLPANPIDMTQREMRKRMRSYYVIHDRTPAAMALQRALFWVGMHVMPRPAPKNLDLYFGSAWITVTIDTARWLVRQWRDPDIQRYFNRMFCVDEVFFPTFIANAPVDTPPAHEDVRHIVWEGRGNPRTLTIDDWDGMIESRCYFARKFDPVISAPLIERVLRERLGVPAPPAAPSRP